MNNVHITRFRGGFPYGYTRILEKDTVLGMEFGIWKLKIGMVDGRREDDVETSLVVLGGKGLITVEGKHYEVSRKNIFTRKPWAFLVPPGCGYSIESPDGELEIAVVKVENGKTFAPVVLRPEEIPSERRGEGLALGTMERVVRAIFGDPNAPKRAQPKESNLVVGEVVNFPGKWSSYPPHYHPQPEFYYYRFDRPEGYGFSHVAEPAPVVKTHDVVKILSSAPHAQVAAPGYAMWYLWVVRHLPGNRYEGNPPFTFSPEHKWTLDPDAKFLTPKDIEE